MKKKLFLSPLIIIILIAVLGVGIVSAAIYFGGGGGGDGASSINLQKGLVAWLKFNGNAKDSTPYGNHGTVNGATLAADRKGQSDWAYSFDGVDDYIQISDSDSLDIDSAITISAWVSPSSTTSASWLPGWNYRKRIPITENSGSDLTNYQVEVTNIDTEALINDNKLQAACQDLRFTDSSGNSIDYWMEDGQCDSATTSAWIEVPSLPASQQTDVYMYYGNSSAAAGSNGTNTFLCFDDFSGASLDPKWSTGGEGSIGVTGGYAYPTDYGSGASWHGPTMTANFSETVAADAGFEMVTTFYWDNPVIAPLGYTYLMAGSYYVYVDDAHTNVVESEEYLYGSGLLFSDCTAGGQSCFTNDWHTVTLRKDGSNLKYWKDVTLRYDDTASQLAISNASVYFKEYSTYDPVDIRVSSIRVRKYTSSEPSVGGKGSEEGAFFITSKGNAYAVRAGSGTFSGSINNSSSSASMSPSGWQHVVMTYDGVNQKLYANGNLEDSQALAEAISTNDNDLIIGNGDFAGLIDDLRIYNRALSAAEVEALHDEYINSGLRISELQKGLVAWLKLDGNAKDLTPYGNHGTVSGATLVADRKGQDNKAYSFDGVDDYIQLSDSDSLDIDSAITVAAWVNPSGAGSGGDWLVGWGYRKQIPITGSSGASTGYQVKVTTYYGAGSDSAGVVYLNSHSETNFDDIRFTDGDGNTLLDYWMESESDSDNAVWWVKVNDDLGSNQNIYVYYGNSGASSLSDGDDTFELFDHFTGGSLDGSKWTEEKGSVSLSSSLVNFNYRSIIRSNQTFSRGIRIREYSNEGSTGQYQRFATWWGDLNSYHDTYAQPEANQNGNSYYAQYYSDYYHQITIHRQVSDVTTQLDIDNAIYLGTSWHTLEFLIDTDDYLKVTVDDVEKLSSTDSTFTTQEYYIFRNGYVDVANQPCDWIFVSKYIYPEPSVGTAESEEEPSFVISKANAYGIRAASGVFSGSVNNSSSSASMPSSGWQHVAMTYDGTNRKLYANGSLEDSQALSGAISTNDNDLFIGNEGFTGLIDDIRIYNRALSADEISALSDEYSGSGIVISDLQKGLVADWKMDGNAKDSTPYSNHGTVNVATLSADRKGQDDKAYSFDGSSSYIDFGTADNLGKMWTRSWWIKRNVDSGDVEYLSTTGSQWGYGYMLEINASDNIMILTQEGQSPYTQYSVTASSTISTGEWYFITATFDGTYMKIYVNGVLKGTSADYSGYLAASYTKNQLGRARIWGTNEYGYNFNGLIDNVRIYDRVLSANEITALYESY